MPDDPITPAEARALVDRVRRAAGMHGIAVGGRESADAIADEAETENLIAHELVSLVESLAAQVEALAKENDLLESEVEWARAIARQVRMVLDDPVTAALERLLLTLHRSFARRDPR
jgi:hypothetical protein